MKKVEIRKIDPWAAARISLCIQGSLGLVLGMVSFLGFMGVGSIISSLTGTSDISYFNGTVSVVMGLIFSFVIAVIYAVTGTVWLMIMVVLYNYFAALTGGVSLEVSEAVAGGEDMNEGITVKEDYGPGPR